jgi:hypothetical protein
MRILTPIDMTPVALLNPTIGGCADGLPADAASGTIVFDANRQRLRLRVEGGWVTLNASGFSPD